MKTLFRPMLYLLWLLLLSEAATAQEVKYTLVVAKDGSGEFTSIQEAIDHTKAFPDRRVTIFIKKGVYREKIRVPAFNTKLTLQGEDPAATIITYDDYFDKMARGRNSTFYTYTLSVEANDFIARDLTIENTAGPVGQAVALSVTGDRDVFVNCIITGNQDTLYVAGERSRQYFLRCRIEGTTDFIFGEATAVFDSCQIVAKSSSYITAASTTKGNEFGLVFMNCHITCDPEAQQVYLGRPWRPYAQTVLINCSMDRGIRPEGWHNWSTAQAGKTTFYAEYGGRGPGAATTERVPWSHRLSADQAAKYTLMNILAVPSDENKTWYEQSEYKQPVHD